MATERKFTPGPWHACEEGMEPDGKGTVAFGRNWIMYSDAVPSGGVGEARANATLAAAAPDLYAALEAMFAIGTTEECHAGPCGHEACTLTKAALAKARGES